MVRVLMVAAAAALLSAGSAAAQPYEWSEQDQIRLGARVATMSASCAHVGVLFDEERLMADVDAARASMQRKGYTQADVDRVWMNEYERVKMHVDGELRLEPGHDANSPSVILAYFRRECRKLSVEPRVVPYVARQ